MLTEKADYIKEVFSGLEKTQESMQLIPMLLALILNDMVFEKYGYEEVLNLNMNLKKNLNR